MNSMDFVIDPHGEVGLLLRSGGPDSRDVLILGDPEDLYVCSDAADKPDEYTMLRSAWEASLRSTIVVAGSTVPRVDPDFATIGAIEELRYVHLFYDRHASLDDPEFLYHASAYTALCDAITADRAPWR